MVFFQFFKQLDEILYEVMSWGAFYPVTLWKVVRHPVAMMDYADSELSDAPERQYRDVLSPPLFLLLSVILAHCLELALIGDSPSVASRHRLAILISDDTNLIVYRLVCFAIFPLITSTVLLRIRGVTLDRDGLRLPFYAQCYAAAVYALVFSVAATFAQLHWDWAKLLAFAIIVVAIPAYLILQTLWFRDHLKSGVPKAVMAAIGSYGAGLAALAIVTPLFL